MKIINKGLNIFASLVVTGVLVACGSEQENQELVAMLESGCASLDGAEYQSEKSARELYIYYRKAEDTPLKISFDQGQFRLESDIRVDEGSYNCMDGEYSIEFFSAGQEYYFEVYDDGDSLFLPLYDLTVPVTFHRR